MTVEKWLSEVLFKLEEIHEDVRELSVSLAVASTSPGR